MQKYAPFSALSVQIWHARSIFLQKLINVWMQSGPDRVLIPAVRHPAC